MKILIFTIHKILIVKKIKNKDAKVFIQKNNKYYL